MSASAPHSYLVPHALGGEAVLFEQLEQVEDDEPARRFFPRVVILLEFVAPEDIHGLRDSAGNRHPRQGNLPPVHELGFRGKRDKVVVHQLQLLWRELAPRMETKGFRPQLGP